MMNIYKSYIRPQLEYCSQLWNLGYIGDTKSLERVQKRWTKAVYGLEELPYPDRLRRLNLFSFQGRLLRGDMILVWKIFNGKCAISPEQVFTMDNFITRGHRFKIFVPRTRLDARKRFFPVRVVQTWNSLGHDTVDCTTLDSFKSLLHRDLANRLYDTLVWTPKIEFREIESKFPVTFITICLSVLWLSLLAESMGETEATSLPCLPRWLVIRSAPLSHMTQHHCEKLWSQLVLILYWRVWRGHSRWILQVNLNKIYFS